MDDTTENEMNVWGNPDETDTETAQDNSENNLSASGRLSTQMETLDNNDTASKYRNPDTDGHFDLGKNEEEEEYANSPYLVEQNVNTMDAADELLGIETSNDNAVQDSTEDDAIEYERSAWGRNSIKTVQKQAEFQFQGGEEGQAQQQQEDEQYTGAYAAEVSWVAYLDPLSGQPYFVDEISGYKTWVQPEDGNFVWGEVSDDIIERHFTKTGDTDENLGPDYRDTPWKMPSYEKGMEARKEMLFEQGQAPICGITSRRLGKLGVGIRLYFEVSYIFGILLFVTGIISIPALVLYSSGEGIHYSEHVDVLELATLTPGMFSPSYDYIENVTSTYALEKNDTSKVAYGLTLEQYSTSILKDQIVKFGSIQMKRSDAASMVSVIDFFISFILLLAYPLLFIYMKSVDEETGFQTTTTADYSVEVHGKMPDGTTEEELIEHFSNLYRLDEADFRNRPVFQANNKNHSSVQREGAVKPVQDITHIVGSGGEKYLGKWVAEVTLHYNNGDTLLKYLELSSIQNKIRHWRGIAKKYSEGTSYSKGPNSSKVQHAENKLISLEFQEEERMKAIHENRDVIGAFVIFNHEESYLRCVEDYQLDKNQRTCSCCTCCHINLKSLLFKNKYKMEVKRAAEAGDIQFEYLPFRGKNTLRRTISKCYIFAILIISFLLIFSLHSYKRVVEKDIPDLSACTTRRLSYILVGNNYTGQTLNFVRTKKQDDECRAAVGPDAFYIVANELNHRYGDLSSSCSSSVHSCIKGGASKDTLCPCVSTGSIDVCTDPDSDEYPAKMVAGCFCVNEFQKAVQRSQGQAWLDKNDDVCGKVLTNIGVASTVQALGSIFVTGINICISKVIHKIIKYERHYLKSHENGQIVLVSLIAQFMNSALVIILIYQRFPGTEASATPFLFNGEHDDFGKFWYITVGVFIQTTILISTVSSHAMFLYYYLIRFPANRLKAQRMPEQFATQSELNDAVAAGEFPLEVRVAAQLLLAYVPIVFSPGMPVLLFIGAFGVTLGAMVDKLNLARHSKHPPPVDSNVPRQMIRTLPYFVVMRLIYASWVFSNPTIFPSNSASVEYTTYLQEKAQSSENMTWLFGRLGTNTAIPHVVLLSFLLAYLLAATFLFPILEGSYHAIEKILESCNCHFLHSKVRPRAAGNSPFTEYYCERFDANFKQVTKKNKPKHYTANIRRAVINGVEMTAPLVPQLSNLDAKHGWRVTNAISFPEHTDNKETEMAHYKIKSWMVNCTIRGQQRYADQLKLTWEVCQEDGISSYRMYQNPKYAVIDELRAEKLLLHSPLKDNNGDDTIVEEGGANKGGASKYVYEETQEEGQYNYVEQQQDQYQESNTQQEQYQEGETPVEQDYSHLQLSESDAEDDV